MADSADQRAASRKKADAFFPAAERRDARIRDEIEKERKATVAKTDRLRALRLSKEASDRETLAAEAAAAPAKIKKPRATKAKRAEPSEH